ncbi:ThuA domain-containing protein [Paenibacillus albicereus]|uniref:ThuA domain-containing protein n=1 Tax=Paenibacillus albicereus TaxID=2726185 RepID=A0A6H2GUD7_9BACL|nr:ThuA domain-containing protein [Paenibacillus albicereus]QJC51005.1 ThuA domain-containing protein [Paenibacillus albicereus]
MVIQVGRGGMAHVPDAEAAAVPGLVAERMMREALPYELSRPATRKLAGLGALLLGDREAQSHPLASMQEALGRLLGEDFDVQASDSYGLLEEEMPADQSLIVACSDRWERPLSDRQAAGLARFVERGGGLVLLHCGISLACHPLLEHLAGARCEEHPEGCRLSFEPVVGKAGVHPAVQDLQPFELTDEPYRYAFRPSMDREVILEYVLGGERRPAAWAHRAGRGRVVALMPGHGGSSLRHPQLQRLIRRSSLWAAGRI